LCQNCIDYCQQFNCIFRSKDSYMSQNLDTQLFKIGGTSMSNIPAVLQYINYLLSQNTHNRDFNYNFVVSAFGGVTDLLLENKKTGVPGVYGVFKDRGDFGAQLDSVLRSLIKINVSQVAHRLDLESANEFITYQLTDTRRYLNDLLADDGLDADAINSRARERLAAIGESHSAYNLSSILNSQNIESDCVDLSSFDTPQGRVEDTIKDATQRILGSTISIITGYVGANEGLMAQYDRGYSEVTASLLAVSLNVARLCILKEFNLSSADPRLVENPVTVSTVSSAMAAELAMVGMEAIHPSVAGFLRKKGIDIQVQNIATPDDPGTLITHRYIDFPVGVQMITGAEIPIALTIRGAEMGEGAGYIWRLSRHLKNTNILLVSSDATGITAIIPAKSLTPNIIQAIRSEFPDDQGVTTTFQESTHSIILITGSRLNIPGLFAKAAASLANADVNIEAASQPINPNSVQIAVLRHQYQEAVRTLYTEFFPAE
jgi:aspartate kinase